MISFDPPSKG